MFNTRDNMPKMKKEMVWHWVGPADGQPMVLFSKVRLSEASVIKRTYAGRPIWALVCPSFHGGGGGLRLQGYVNWCKFGKPSSKA